MEVQSFHIGIHMKIHTSEKLVERHAGVVLSPLYKSRAAFQFKCALIQLMQGEFSATLFVRRCGR